VVGENGGGAFILLYVLLALLLGLPLLIGELILGKSTRQSVLTAASGLNQASWKPFRWMAVFSVLLSLVVLSYYAVVSGWVLHFLMQFCLHLFSSDIEMQGSLVLLQKNGWLQIGLASVHLLITVVVVIRGVQEGLEKFIGAMMPAFTILLALLMFKSMALPSSIEAMRFLFYPDFSKLTWFSMGHAVGHVFFTLSVGFGTMVTFGSYLRDTDHVPTAGLRVTLMDTFLSLISGLLIFPIVLQASNIPLTDPGLMFEALPRFLSTTTGGTLFGLAFFLSLYLAALGASIGLLETIVSNAVDGMNVGRVRSGWVAGFLTLIMATGPALSGSVLKTVKIGGRGILEFLDSALINWCLPLIAVGMSLALSHGMKRSQQEKFFVDSQKIESAVLFPHWIFVLRYIVPGVIALALVFQLIGIYLS
jgi:NSS family neurotransmitter:Na+ symporter